jgi:phage terminase small subunit
VERVPNPSLLALRRLDSQLSALANALGLSPIGRRRLGVDSSQV